MVNTCKMGHISSVPLIAVKDFMSEYNTDKISITENSLKLSRNYKVMIFSKSGTQVGNIVLKMMLDLENISRSFALIFRFLENM